MLLEERLKKIGDSLFRFRAYIPLLLVIFLILGMRRFYYFGSSHLYDLIFEFVCLSVSLLGFAIRVFTIGYCRKGTSGKNIKGQYAQNLNTDGMYSIMRNPLYLGNLFIILGVSMLSLNYELIIINLLLYTCFYVPIVLREEEFLVQAFGEVYLKYVKRTPTFLPNFKLWKKPELKFNFLRVLHCEHDAFMGIIWGFYAMELLSDYIINKKFCFDVLWTVIFVSTLVLWCLLKCTEKQLKSLDKGI